jgi:Leucine-rich repeat (LRR) protein
VSPSPFFAAFKEEVPSSHPPNAHSYTRRILTGNHISSWDHLTNLEIINLMFGANDLSSMPPSWGSGLRECLVYLDLSENMISKINPNIA